MIIEVGEPECGLRAVFGPVQAERLVCVGQDAGQLFERGGRDGELQSLFNRRGKLHPPDGQPEAVGGDQLHLAALQFDVHAL